MLVIFARLEAQQRELETVLAAGFAVAAATVAAQLGKDGHDLIGEIDQRIVAEVNHRHFQRSGRTLSRTGCDRRRAIGSRDDEPA